MTGIQGFAAIPTWMIRDKSIPRSALLVYAALASRSGLGEIFPSQATIAEEAGVGERTARTMLTKLEELGVIQRHRRTIPGQKRATDAYTLHPNGLPANLAGRSDLAATEDVSTGNQQQPTLSIEAEIVRQRDARKPKRGPHPLPASWAPTPTHATLAAERGVDLSLEAESFRAHAEANAREAVVWDAAFRQWLLKARPAQPVLAGGASEWPAGMEWMGLQR